MNWLHLKKKTQCREMNILSDTAQIKQYRNSVTLTLVQQMQIKSNLTRFTIYADKKFSFIKAIAVSLFLL